MKLRNTHLTIIYIICLFSATILSLSSVFLQEYFEMIGTTVVLVIASTPCIFCLFELAANKQWILFSLLPLNVEDDLCDDLKPVKKVDKSLSVAHVILFFTIIIYIYKIPHSFSYRFNASCFAIILLGISIIFSQLIGMYVYLLDLLEIHSNKGILNTNQSQLIVNKLLRSNEIYRICIYAFLLCLPFVAVILTILLRFQFIPAINKYIFVYFFLGISFYFLGFVLFRFFLTNNLIMIIKALEHEIKNSDLLFYNNLLRYQYRISKLLFLILLFIYPFFFYILFISHS
jgi:hypothetical protein